MLVLLASLRQSYPCALACLCDVVQYFVGLPLSSPQNKHLISLHTCQIISPTQSHTLQSSLQQRILLVALAQRENAFFVELLDIGTFPANCLFKRLFSLPNLKHKTLSSLPFFV